MKLTEFIFSNLIGAYAAALSTIVAYIQLNTYLKSRVSLDATMNSRGCHERGNDIRITNKSTVTVEICNFEIIRMKYRIFKSDIKSIFNLEDESYTKIIQPHTSHEINFSEKDYFSTNNKAREEFGKLYIKIWISGRRSPFLLNLE